MKNPASPSRLCCLSLLLLAAVGCSQRSQLAGDTELLGQGNFLRLVRHKGWESVERLGTGKVACIIAITNDNKMLFVQQFRPPLNAQTIEFPAGLVGDLPQCPNESVLDAARRELLEETGYHAHHLESLVAGPPAPGFSSEIITYFLATGLTAAAAETPREEGVLLHEIPLKDVHNWLMDIAQQGRLYVNANIYTGLYLVLQRLPQHRAAILQ